MDFTAKERDALAQAQLSVFRDRVILKAQPPIEKAALTKIEKICGGALPPELASLWQTAFGGELNYDLRATFGEHQASLSFSELFYPKSRGYRDLWGWIEFELERAEDEAGEKWNGLLPFLPFGGFEYLERLYVRTEVGPRFGNVIVWGKGIPPAWTFRLHEDSQASLAPDVCALFDSLRLECDPWTADPEKFPSGMAMLEAIAALKTGGSGGRTAAAKLEELVRSAILDWRSAVTAGTITDDVRLRGLALESAADTDDVELIERLKSLGCDLDQSLRGGASALDHALACKAFGVVRVLLDAGVSVKNALRTGADSIDLELARELIARGGQVDQHAVLSAANRGQEGVAELLLAARSLDVSPRQIAERARSLAEDAEQTAQRIESGSLSSNMTPADERARAARLRKLASAADP